MLFYLVVSLSFIFQGPYRICFKNDQYFTKKFIYIGVIALHSDFLPEANVDLTNENKNNMTALMNNFSVNAMVHTLINLYSRFCPLDYIAIFSNSSSTTKPEEA